MTAPDRTIPSLGPLSEYDLRDILRNQQERADVSDKMHFPLSDAGGAVILQPGSFVRPLLDGSDPDPENWVYGPPTYTFNGEVLEAVIVLLLTPPENAVLLYDNTTANTNTHPTTRYIVSFYGEYPVLINATDTPNPFYLRPNGVCEIFATEGFFGMINAFDAEYTPQIKEYTDASVDVDATNFKFVITAATGCSAAVVKTNTTAKDGDVIRLTNMKATGDFTLSAGVGVTLHVPATLQLVLAPYESATLRRMALNEWVIETGPAA